MGQLNLLYATIVRYQAGRSQASPPVNSIDGASLLLQQQQWSIGVGCPAQAQPNEPGIVAS
jgi:hypothetical protein